jgi:3-oxoacyl-[acyl-carrier protein] reductase
VLLTYRSSAEAAREIAAQIEAHQGRALVTRADVSTLAGCEQLVGEAVERLGSLDVWVNNAGADVLTGAAAGWDWDRKLERLLDVDLKGTIACSRAVTEVMRRQPAAGPS